MHECTTAYRAVKHREILQQVELIAIFGAGAVSLSCVMLLIGAKKIVATDLSNDALDLAMKPGVKTDESHSFGIWTCMARLQHIF